MYGLKATRAAAPSPAARATSVRAAHHATGIVAIPKTADSDRIPTSPDPNSLVQTHASM